MPQPNGDQTQQQDNGCLLGLTLGVVMRLDTTVNLIRLCGKAIECVLIDLLNLNCEIKTKI